MIYIFNYESSVLDGTIYFLPIRKRMMLLKLKIGL